MPNLPFPHTQGGSICAFGMSTKLVLPRQTAAQVRELAAMQKLRQLTGLQKGQDLHPAPQPFVRQADAMEFLHALIERGEYTTNQLGLFAEETDDTGK